MVSLKQCEDLGAGNCFSCSCLCSLCLLLKTYVHFYRAHSTGAGFVRTHLNTHAQHTLAYTQIHTLIHSGFRAFAAFSTPLCVHLLSINRLTAQTWI